MSTLLPYIEGSEMHLGSVNTTLLAAMRKNSIGGVGALPAQMFT